MADYYGIARRQGASGYIAALYEKYRYAAERRGVRALSCRAYLAAIDNGVTPTVGGAA